MRIFWTIVFSITYFVSIGQDVMLQGWYWDYPKTAGGENWTDTLSAQVTNLGEAGFTHIWLPPLSRASFGSNSNGYDPKDLYDLGEYGLGATGFGTRSQVDALITAIDANGMEAVADVVYNHRDGGRAENNPAVEGWMENLNCTKISNGDQPFPSDRVRFILPIGGSTGNGAGTYYIKVASASKHPNFYDRPYTFYIETNTFGFQGIPAQTENEGIGNGGGDCGQSSEITSLGVDMLATIDNVGSCSGGCGVDEFAVTVTTSQFDAAGDSLFIYMNNTAGYSDHYIYSIWNGSADVQSDLIYQTYTDFTSMPSGQGDMNWENFKPNGNPTNLSGDWDAMLFFYDYDQNVNSTRQELIDWSQWLWTDANIRGLRMDAVKHFDPTFVGALLDSMHNVGQNPTMVVGEFFDTNAGSLNNWVNNVKNSTTGTTDDSIKVKVFDFAMREGLKNACDLFGYDARNLFNSGIVNAVGGSTENVATFVNNHDYRKAGEPVQNDPILAYAYMMLNRSIGTPTVFYPDYFGTSIPHAPSAELKSDIDIMMDTYDTWMINGSYDYLSRFGTPYAITFNDGVESASVIFQTTNGGMDGLSDAIVMINFAGDTLDVELPLSSSSNKGVGTTFHETSGKGLIPKSVTNASNRLRIAVPPRSYGIWVSSDTSVSCTSDSIIFVDKAANGLNNGNSWDDAFNNLGSAIAHSNFCVNVKEIWVKEGTYTSNITDDRTGSFVLSGGTILRGGFPAAGNPTISDYAPSSNVVELTGDIGTSGDNSDNLYSVLSFSPGDTIKVYGVKITNGNAIGSINSQQQGGGISNNFNVYMKDCNIEDNQASLNGNAIFQGSGASLILEDCTITNNSGSSTDIFIDSNSTLINRGSTTINN